MVELAQAQHRLQKLQRQNPSQRRLFKDFNKLKEFLLSLCKLKCFQSWILEKQYCQYESSSSSKGPIQNRDSHKHSQIAASIGQTMCIFFLPSRTHGSGFWSIHIENKTLASYGKCVLPASQILNSLKSSKEILQKL